MSLYRNRPLRLQVVQMPMGQFTVGVFLAPLVLGLLFTPLFLLDKGGLSFDGTREAEAAPGEGSVVAATRGFSALLNVYLYAYALDRINSFIEL